MPFPGQAPSKLKLKKKKIRIGYEYIEESFDTIFNMCFFWHMAYESGKSPMV